MQEGINLCNLKNNFVIYVLGNDLRGNGKGDEKNLNK